MSSCWEPGAILVVGGGVRRGEGGVAGIAFSSSCGGLGLGRPRTCHGTRRAGRWWGAGRRDAGRWRGVGRGDAGRWRGAEEAVGPPAGLFDGVDPSETRARAGHGGGRAGSHAGGLRKGVPPRHQRVGGPGSQQGPWEVGTMNCREPVSVRGYLSVNIGSS